MLVSAEHMTGLASVMPGAGRVAVLADSAGIEFHADDLRLRLAPARGVFPDYRPVLDASITRRVRFRRRALAHALLALGALGPERSRRDAVAWIDIRDDSALFRRTAADVGEGWVAIPATLEGPEAVVGFPMHYLRAMVDRLNGRDVELAFGDEFGPTLWCSPSEPGFRYHLLPIYAEDGPWRLQLPS